MNAAKIYASADYLSACDLDGKEVTLPIEAVTLEHLKGGPADPGKDRVCVRLKGAKKCVVLNKGNCRTICKTYGNETEAWVGKQLTVYADTCTAFGVKNVPCIRVRIPRQD